MGTGEKETSNENEPEALGWGGPIARVLDLFARMTPADAMQISKDELAAPMSKRQVAG